jgi:hypothetical protein
MSRPQFHLRPLGALAWWHAWKSLVAKVGTSNPDRTISLKRLQCVVENKHIALSLRLEVVPLPSVVPTNMCTNFPLLQFQLLILPISSSLIWLSKVKCTLVQALRLCTGRTAHKGSRGIALLFHDHGTRTGWGVSVTPRPFLTPGKVPVPIVQETGWAPGPVWRSAENLTPTGIRSSARPAPNQSLYRLSYPVHFDLITVLIIIRNYISAKDGTPNYSFFFSLLLLSVTVKSQQNW